MVTATRVGVDDRDGGSDSEAATGEMLCSTTAFTVATGGLTGTELDVSEEVDMGVEGSAVTVSTERVEEPDLVELLEKLEKAEVLSRARAAQDDSPMRKSEREVSLEEVVEAVSLVRARAGRVRREGSREMEDREPLADLEALEPPVLALAADGLVSSKKRHVANCVLREELAAREQTEDEESGM